MLLKWKPWVLFPAEGGGQVNECVGGGWCFSAAAQLPPNHAVLWGSEHKSGGILTLVEDFVLPRGCLLLAFLSLVLLTRGPAGVALRGHLMGFLVKTREVN